MNLRNRMAGRLSDVPLDRIWIVLFLIEFVRGAFLVAYLPGYAVDHLGISGTAVGLAVSVHYLADSAVKCVVGYILDKISQKLVLTGGLLLCVISLCVMNSTHSAGLLLLASALLGLGGSPVWLACLGRIDSARRGEQMAILYLFWMAGLGLGPVVINFLMDYGYREAFAAMLAMAVAGTVMTALAPTRASEKAAFTLGLGEQAQELMQRIKAMGFLLPGMVVQTLAGGLLVPVLSRFASETIGLSHSQLSVIMISGGTAAGIGLIPMGRVSDRIGSRWILIGGFGTFAAALFAVSFARTFGQAEWLACILGLSYATLLPAWNALLASYVPESSKGVGWGMVSTMEGIGVILGPLAGGWLADRYSLSLPFRICAALFAVIAVVYFRSPLKKSAIAR